MTIERALDEIANEVKDSILSRWARGELDPEVSDNAKIRKFGETHITIEGNGEQYVVSPNTCIAYLVARKLDLVTRVHSTNLDQLIKVLLREDLENLIKFIKILRR